MSKKVTARARYALLELSSKRTCDISSTVTVGRENTDLVFQTVNMTSLSRQHFQIIIERGLAWIEDLGSSNGTKLNDVRIKAHTRHELKNGDSIIAGKVVFTFQVRPSIRDSIVASGEEVDQPVRRGRLAPEISLVRMPVLKRRSSEEVSGFIFSSISSEQRPKRKKKNLFSRFPVFQKHWTTICLALVLFALAFYELRQIWSSPYQAPHSTRDLTLRYLFSMGFMYVFMILVQFMCTATFARRWYMAVPSVLVSLFFGSVVGDKLDGVVGYQKAETENKMAATKVVNPNSRTGQTLSREPADQ